MRKQEKKKVVDIPLTGRQMKKIFAMSKGAETKPLVRHLTDGRAGKVCELTKADAIIVIRYLIQEQEDREEAA